MSDELKIPREPKLYPNEKREQRINLSGGGNPSHWVFKIGPDGTYFWNPEVIKSFVDAVEKELVERGKSK